MGREVLIHVRAKWKLWASLAPLQGGALPGVIKGQPRVWSIVSVDLSDVDWLNGLLCCVHLFLPPEGDKLMLSQGFQQDHWNLCDESFSSRFATLEPSLTRRNASLFKHASIE